MGRVLVHLGGAAFLLWVVLACAKWAFVAGLAGFGLYAWETRPGGEERERRFEDVRQARPATPEERVAEAVNGSSAVKLHLIERRRLEAVVEARNPTGAAVDLEGVRCRVLYSPDGGQPRDIGSRGPWRVRLEPGASHRGEVAFYESDVSAATGVAPVAVAEYRCGLRVRVVPPQTAPPGAPSNPVRITPNGYRHPVATAPRELVGGR